VSAVFEPVDVDAVLGLAARTLAVCDTGDGADQRVASCALARAAFHELMVALRDDRRVRHAVSYGSVSDLFEVHAVSRANGGLSRLRIAVGERLTAAIVRVGGLP
jgi:hypothetical protein